MAKQTKSYVHAKDTMRQKGKKKNKTKNEEAFLFTYMERLSQSIAQLKKKQSTMWGGKVFLINGAEGLPWWSSG